MGTISTKTSLRLIAVLAGGLLVAAPAGAQTTATTQNGNGGAAWAPWWDVSAGYEGDSRDTGYAFFGPGYYHPISDDTAVVARLNVNYLTYEFDNGDGTRTHVSGPGFAPMAGLRFGRRNNLKLMVGPDFKRREREVVLADSGLELSEEDDTRVGARFAADLYNNFGDAWNLHALASYGTAEDWLWTRVGLKRQLTNHDWRGPVALFLGAEGIAQGNDEVRQLQAGALTEIVHARSGLSLMLRAGFKNSSFERAEDDNGPYFGIGLWRRF